jgi:hypothetical protein
MVEQAWTVGVFDGFTPPNASTEIQYHLHMKKPQRNRIEDQRFLRKLEKNECEKCGNLREFCEILALI